MGCHAPPDVGVQRTRPSITITVVPRGSVRMRNFVPSAAADRSLVYSSDAAPTCTIALKISPRNTRIDPSSTEVFVVHVHGVAIGEVDRRDRRRPGPDAVAFAQWHDRRIGQRLTRSRDLNVVRGGGQV